MRNQLMLDNISIREVKYPYTYDKRTSILNHILNGIILNVSERSNVFCEFRCYQPNSQYYLYVKTGRYVNPEILMEQVYHTVEQVMDFFDLSDVENFEIKVEEGTRFHKCTYYDLAYWGWDRRTPFGPKPNYSKEKYNKIVSYFREKMRKEEKEYNEKMNRALYGGSIFLEKSDYVIPVTKKKGIVRNIKEKVLNLF